MSSNLIKHVLPSALVVCKNKSLSQVSSRLMSATNSTKSILPFQPTVSNLPQLSQLSAVPLPHLQQKVVCPKVSGGQSSDLLENPLGLLTSCMKCESWVIHSEGGRRKEDFYPYHPLAVTALPPGVYAVCHLTSFCPSPGIGSISCWPSCEKQPCESRRK